MVKKYLVLLCCTIIKSNRVIPAVLETLQAKKPPLSCCCVTEFWSQAHIPYHTSDVILLTLGLRCLSLKY